MKRDYVTLTETRKDAGDQRSGVPGERAVMGVRRIDGVVSSRGARGRTPLPRDPTLGFAGAVGYRAHLPLQVCEVDLASVEELGDLRRQAPV